MYLHELTMTAIGPFRSETRVDFARLSSAGLFLLKGPTGSGKSTIIDAITFALYGKVAGSAASDSRMASRVADDEPTVDLVFEVDAGVFRIRRTPSYERVKRRGTGTTAVQASVKLWRLTSPQSSAGDLISNRVGEADAAVRDIVGLSRDQFVQTVILPQGEFSRFLHSSPDERREVLRRLFATDIYEAATTELGERRSAAKAACAEASARSEAAQTAFVTAAELDAVASQVIVDAESSEDVEKLVAAAVTELETTVTELASRSKTATSAAKAAQAALEFGKQTRQAQAKLLEAQTEALALDAAEAMQAERLDRIGSIRQMQSLLPVHEGLLAARRSRDEAQAGWQTALGCLPGELAHAEASVRRATAAEVTGQLATLTSAAQAEARLRADLAQLAQWQSDHEGLERLHTQIQAGATDLNTSIAALNDRLIQLAPLAETLRLREQQRLAAARIDAAAARVPAAQLKLTAAAEALAQAHTVAASVAQQAAAARRGYIAGISGVLADQLVAGSPCPVCGSPDHPAPTAKPADAMTEDDVSQTEAKLADATEALDQARSQHQSCKHEADTLTIESRGVAASEAARALADADSELRQARSASRDLPEVRQQLFEAQTKFERVASDADRTNTALATLAERIANATRAASELDAELTRERAGCESVQQRIDELTKLSHELRVASETEASLAAASADVDTRAAQFDRLLAEAGLGSEAEFAARTPDQVHLKQLEEQVAHHEARRAAVRAVLCDEAILAQARVQPPDLAALAEAAEEAAETRDQAVLEHGLLRERAQRAAEYAQAVCESVANADRVSRAARPIIRMAEVAAATSPDNLSRMPLVTYVLLDRFRSVVAAANERLSAMSDGRYSLAHHTDLEDRGRRSGLGLRISDHVTDCERDPKTLSGGETFYVSLALALGLADVVTAEAGGTRLGTLFIDEGFGSLDSETLDAVLTEVSRLRQAGRVVGIVSHVEELKQRICDRIEVEPLGGGVSTVRMVG